MPEKPAGMQKLLKAGVFKGLLVLLLIGGVSHAQDRQQNSYLIPRTVYVGDRATLVLSLPTLVSVSAKDTIVSMEAPANQFPSLDDIVIHKAVLERRAGGGGRLLVDFSAYAPGLLELPSIEIGGERFSSLRITVNSILDSDGSGMALSGPAPPLAIPGTGFLIYGTMSAIALILLLFFWAMFWGRRRMNGWIQKWKRRRLIVSMRNVEKRLRKSLLKGGNRPGILDMLSAEFRAFLSFFSGKNCWSMTAIELECLPPLAAAVNTPGGVFLGAFFRRCDSLRFSGGVIPDADILSVLADLRFFLVNLDRAERGKTGKEEKKA